MIFLAIDWSTILVKTGQFILSFSILVVLHELGHFLPAKWFKCRVEKFYLFFNPWFSLYKKKIGETEWGLGWVPFGGYVKIAGMIDESVDKEQMKLPPKPDEFRSKKAWQRLIIMLGGVTVNVILAIVIFISITWVWGEDYLPPQNVKYGLYADSLSAKAGMRDGDIVTHVNGAPLKDELKLAPTIISQEATNITVLRDGKDVVLQIPEGTIRALNDNKANGFAEIRFPTVIDSVQQDKPNKDLLQVGDSIIGIENIGTTYFVELAKALENFKDKKVNLKIIRKDSLISVPVQVSNDGTLGFIRRAPSKMGLEMETQHYTFLESIPAGLNRCGRTLKMYVTGLKQLFTGKADPNKSLGSVISIGNVFPGTWDWESFWTLTAVFSIILAFMNVLPIPALDGGHALFTLYEMITGRKPSDKFMEYAQMVGMVLLLGLMAYALGLDFFRLFKG